MKPTEITELQKMVRESSLQDLYGNTTLATDYYKFTHPPQYHPGVQREWMYGEARIGGQYKKVAWLGMEMIIGEGMLTVPAFKQLLLTRAWVQSAGNFDYFAKEAWERVTKLGYVPIEIWSLPEGTVVPEGTPMYWYTSTDAFFAKHLSLIEGTMMHNWTPTDINSRFLHVKEETSPFFAQTNCLEDLDYSVLDFSYRSCTCPQDAVRRGTGFLMHFKSSDNCIADVVGIMKHYNGPQILKSVWATEHSVALSFGPGEGEIAYLKHQFMNAPKDAIVSYLTDTYDDRNFMENVVGHPDIQALIKERTGASVARGDSGKGKETIDMHLHFLERHFGSNIVKGYKVLNHNNKTIWANDVDEHSCVDNYKHIVENGWAANMLVQGGGNGFMTKDVSRDAQRIAIKPYMATIDGVDVPMAKTPKGSPWKSSKYGPFKVVQNPDNGRIETIMLHQVGKAKFDSLTCMGVRRWHNGVRIVGYDYYDVQSNMAATKDVQYE